MERERNKTENGALHDVVHGFYQGVIYCQTFTRFNGTRVNVVSFTPIRIARPSLRQLPRNSKMLKSIMCRSRISFYQIRIIYLESTDRNPFTPLRKE